MAQGSGDMLIARVEEEIVCPRGTVCGRMVHDTSDRIIDDNFVILDNRVTGGEGRYLCACCGQAVAVREQSRWRIHLRRGWVR
jgi:hypothetical protein